MIKILIYIMIVFSLLLAVLMVSGQLSDSLATVNAHPAPNTIIANSSWMQSFVVVTGYTALVIAACFGVLITIISILVLIALISAGIVSVSVLRGIRERSLGKGFRTFLLLVGGFLGGTSGAIILFMISRFMHTLSGLSAILLGALAGILSGLLVALVLYRLSRYLVGRARVKYIPRHINDLL